MNKKREMSNNVKCQSLISVVMGVYNTNRNYLVPAIESILNQTYKNIEFIIVNDCSDEWCASILKDFEKKDSRIFLINNEVNLGITKTLNIGLNSCHGKYIARMDSDDISLPERLEKQAEYLENHLEIHALACCASIYEEIEDCYMNNKYHMDPKKITNRVAGLYRRFNQERIRVKLSYGNVEFTHPTVMYRKEFLDKYSIKYDESLSKAQDYGMWARIQEYRCMYVLQEPLFIYRDNGMSSTRTASEEQIKCANRTKTVKLRQFIGEPTAEEIEAYSAIDGILIAGGVEENVKLLHKIVIENNRKKIYPCNIYNQELLFRTFRKCLYRNNRKVSSVIRKDKFILYNTIKIIPAMVIVYLLDILYTKYKCKQYVNRVRFILGEA